LGSARPIAFTARPARIEGWAKARFARRAHPTKVIRFHRDLL
jgi:hypothetical protein